MKTIFDRVSIRKFQDNLVEEEKIEKILRAAMQAPSAGNQMPWEFIVVKDKKTLEKLSQMSLYAKFIANAPVAIVVLGNKSKMKYPENWMQDLGASVQNILLEITHLGLGGVWATAAPLQERMDYVSKVFNLPEHIIPYCVIPIGYPAEEKKAQSRYDESKVHREGYPLS